MFANEAVELRTFVNSPRRAHVSEKVHNEQGRDYK